MVSGVSRGLGRGSGLGSSVLFRQFPCSKRTPGPIPRGRAPDPAAPRARGKAASARPEGVTVKAILDRLEAGEAGMKHRRLERDLDRLAPAGGPEAAPEARGATK
jgi:hypothetical protein